MLHFCVITVKTHPGHGFAKNDDLSHPWTRILTLLTILTPWTRILTLFDTLTILVAPGPDLEMIEFWVLEEVVEK